MALEIAAPEPWASERLAKLRQLHGRQWSPVLLGSHVMTWLTGLGLADLITAFGTLTGIQARGMRPVARTQLMGTARIVLAQGVILLPYIAYRASTRG